MKVLAYLFLSLLLIPTICLSQSNSVQLSDSHYKLMEFIKTNIQNAKSKKTSHQKTAYVNEAYYLLRYDNILGVWDTTSRWTLYADSNIQNFDYSLMVENWTPQGYYVYDSLIAYADTSNKFYKAYGEDYAIDSVFGYLYDTLTSTWNQYYEEYNIQNTNGDLETHILRYDPGVVSGSPSGFLLLDSAIYNYNSFQELDYLKSYNRVSTPTAEIKDSIVCSLDVNGYRVIDSIYTPNASLQLVYLNRTLYDYDNRYNKIRITADSSNRRTLVFSSTNNLLSDTLYTFGYNGTQFDYLIQRHSTFGRDTNLTYTYNNNGVPTLTSAIYSYYTNNRKDSTIFYQDFGTPTNPNLRLSQKQIYIYNQIVIGVNTIEKGFEDFSIYPNPVNDNLYIKSPRESVDIQLVNIHGQEFYRGYKKGNFKLDVSAFPSGVYFLRLNGISRKIIIQ